MGDSPEEVGVVTEVGIDAGLLSAALVAQLAAAVRGEVPEALLDQDLF